MLVVGNRVFAAEGGIYGQRQSGPIERDCLTFPTRGGGSRLMNILLWWATLVLAVTAAHAEPIASQDIYVLDGNTIDRQGQRIRLVGYDPPDEGQRARCASERTLAARTAARLRQMISRGDKIDLQMVACACPPGTE